MSASSVGHGCSSMGHIAAFRAERAQTSSAACPVPELRCRLSPGRVASPSIASGPDVDSWHSWRRLLRGRRPESSAVFAARPTSAQAAEHDETGACLQYIVFFSPGAQQLDRLLSLFLCSGYFATLLWLLCSGYFENPFWMNSSRIQSADNPLACLSPNQCHVWPIVLLNAALCATLPLPFTLICSPRQLPPK